jgi:hypothetical protein
MLTPFETLDHFAPREKEVKTGKPSLAGSVTAVKTTVFSWFPGHRAESAAFRTVGHVALDEFVENLGKSAAKRVTRRNLRRRCSWEWSSSSICSRMRLAHLGLRALANLAPRCRVRLFAAWASVEGFRAVDDPRSSEPQTVESFGLGKGIYGPRNESAEGEWVGWGNHHQVRFRTSKRRNHA